MLNNNSTAHLGIQQLQPVKKTPRQNAIFHKLDELSTYYTSKVELSKLFEGAIYACRYECKTNPEWFAQAAHSIREILYPLYSPKVPNFSKSKSKKKLSPFYEYGSARMDESIEKEINRLYGKITNIAHHYVNSDKQETELQNVEKTIEELLNDFETVILRALERQTDIHSEIDTILSSDPYQIGL